MIYMLKDASFTVRKSADRNRGRLLPSDAKVHQAVRNAARLEYADPLRLSLRLWTLSGP